ncbi:MAG: cation transporter [Lachnospiraceae bacterium]|nr:cation transporter [Lachnospiraceae bacterium]
MQKKFILEDLDCAHCAGLMEEKIAALEGVKKCTVTFLTRKMVLDIEDGKEAEVIKEAKKIIKKLEPDVEVVEK